MKATHEIFLNFPTQEELIINRERSEKQIYEIFEEWGNGRIIFTMSKTEHNNREKNINNSYDEYTKLKPLEEYKETNNEDKNSNNKNRRYWFNDDIRQELLIKLICFNKLTEFIDNNGQVKENTEKFEQFCCELLKDIYINEDKNTKELILECNSDKEDDYFMEDNAGLAEDKNDNTLNDEKDIETISEYNEEEKIKEESVLNMENNKINNEESVVLDSIKKYYFDSIRKLEDDTVLKIFLLSYFTMKKKIGINKEMSPADMADEFKDEKLQEKLKGKIKSDEKEHELKNFLDPLRFWNDFEIEFSEEINIFDYYKILYNLIPQPKIVTKEKDGKKYLSEELTKTHYRKMNDLENQINEFINNCMEDLKKNCEVQEQITDFIKEHKIEQISNDEFLKSCIEKMKIKQEISFIKTTRSNDIKIKEKSLDKLSDTKTCGMEQYNEELISLYAKGEIKEETVVEGIKMHLENCEKCRNFYNIVKKGFEYRKKRNEQIFFMLKKPYAKPVESLTEEEYLKQSSNDYYKTNYKNNPCPTNFYYLILSLINIGNTKEAKKMLKDGPAVYKDGSFISKTQIDLDRIEK